jgi:hypothetical protein
MKGTLPSVLLSVTNRTAGWWMGHAANAARRGQKAWLAAALKPGKPPKGRHRRPKAK